MPEPLNIALIGAGHMGKHHARALAERPDVRLVAVCDADAERAREVARESGTRPETDPGRLTGRIDAAVIAAATSAHGDLAMPLIEQGTALFIEKPLAATAKEARQIAEAARGKSAVVQVGHILRFDPVTRAAQALGVKPAYMDVSWVAPFTARSMDVGVVMDLVIHGIDLVLHWMGDVPERVDAFGAGVLGPHEDLVNVRLALPGGRAATITASRLSRSRQRVVRLFAPNVYLKLDYGARTVEKMSPKPDLARIDFRDPAAARLAMEDLVEVRQVPVETEPDALRAELDAFLAAARHERPSAVTADEGARAVEVAEQVIAAVRRG